MWSKNNYFSIYKMHILPIINYLQLKLHILITCDLVSRQERTNYQEMFHNVRCQKSINFTHDAETIHSEVKTTQRENFPNSESIQSVYLTE